MKPKTKLEVFFLTGVLALVLFFAIPAVAAARAEVRDDLRRRDITHLKQAVEFYFNEHVSYPTPPESQPSCTSTEDSDSWFFANTSPLLKEQLLDVLPHDVRETQGFHYRYCVTGLDGLNLTNGYFLEARQEHTENETRAFDEDEERKFFYRLLLEDGKRLYRVCGGTEKQCQPE